MVNVLGAPGEVKKVAVRTASGSSHLVQRLGEDMIHRVTPGYVPPEVRARQDALRRFKGRLFVAGNLIETESSMRQLRKRAARTAYAMVDRGLVNEHTTVELRPVLPADALRNSKLNRRRVVIVGFIRQHLEDYGVVSVIHTEHPIMPSEHEETVDAAAVWSTLVPELDGLERQAKKPANNLAMLAMSGIPYAQRVFAGQAVEGERFDHLAQNELLVLGHVGKLPQENVLIRAAAAPTPYSNKGL